MSSVFVVSRRMWCQTGDLGSSPSSGGLSVPSSTTQSVSPTDTIPSQTARWSGSATGLSPFQCAYGYQPPLFPDLDGGQFSLKKLIRRCRRIWNRAHEVLLRSSAHWRTDDRLPLPRTKLGIKFSCPPVNPLYMLNPASWPPGL